MIKYGIWSYMPKNSGWCSDTYCKSYCHPICKTFRSYREPYKDGSGISNRFITTDINIAFAYLSHISQIAPRQFSREVREINE